MHISGLDFSIFDILKKLKISVEISWLYFTRLDFSSVHLQEYIEFKFFNSEWIRHIKIFKSVLVKTWEKEIKSLIRIKLLMNEQLF